MLPAFVVIGAMKAGTSSLHAYLASHPDLLASDPKETDFFAEPKAFARGLPWYHACFTGEGLQAFEASPNYTKRHVFPQVAERMHGVLPDAKLVYLLRDPIERAISHYVHMLAGRPEWYGGVSFADAIRKDDADVVLTSLYHYQLEAWRPYYPPERILLVQAERLDAEPAAVMGEICAFLGVPPRCDSDVLSRRFHESAEKGAPSRIEAGLIRHLPSGRLRRTVRRLGRPFRGPLERPVLSEEDRAVLLNRIGPDVARLREASGNAFPGWSV